MISLIRLKSIFRALKRYISEIYRFDISEFLMVIDFKYVHFLVVSKIFISLLNLRYSIKVI